MSTGIPIAQRLVQPHAVTALIDSLAKGEQSLEPSRLIALDEAIKALRQGWTLLEITRAATRQLACALIVRALQATGGDLPRAACILRIDKQTLLRELHTLPELQRFCSPCVVAPGHEPTV